MGAGPLRAARPVPAWPWGRLSAPPITAIGARAATSPPASSSSSSVIPTRAAAMTNWDDCNPKRILGASSWVGQRVEIISQKNRGQVGIISRSGHGFYAVELENGQGVLMKRAGELELCGGGRDEDAKLWKAATILLCIAETNKQRRQKAAKKREMMMMAAQQQANVSAMAAFASACTSS